MSDRHVVGDSVHVANSFYNGDTLTDPATVALAITDPAGTTTTYTYAAAELTRSSTGEYYRNVTVATAGKWAWQWTGTAPAADVSTGTFTVHPAAIDALDVLSTEEAVAVLKIGPTDATQTARLKSVVTAVSRRLDDLCGPIVKRTITNEPHDLDPRTSSFWVNHGPIYSTPGITLSSYDSSGTLTTYSLEDFDTKPTYGYRLEARGQGGYGARIWARSSTGPGYFGQAVLVTYTAGRYADTGTVDPVFKEAAAVTLINWWQQVLAQPAVAGELDLPYYRFPKLAVPMAALDIIPDSEKMQVPVIA